MIPLPQAGGGRLFRRFEEAVIARVEGTDPGHFRVVAKRLMSVIGDGAHDESPS